jgi:hypothetical protein
VAAQLAAERGLDVWLSPLFHDADDQETFDGVMRAACVCEELRKRHDVRVVLVIGCELSIFMAGLIPGNHALERMAVLSNPSRWTEELFAQGPPVERFPGPDNSGSEKAFLWSDHLCCGIMGGY